MKSDQILKTAELFEKLAQANFESLCKTYARSIANEVAGGIAAINKLVTTNKDAAKSRGIEALDSVFGKIADEARRIAPDGIELSIRDLKAIIGSGTFYTSSFNAGTGYDVMTRQGGQYSPAAYLNRIQKLVLDLEKWADYYKKPTRHDPSIPVA